MVIVINHAGETDLVDHENFKEFKVTVNSGVLDSQTLTSALGRLGTLAADKKHIWIDPNVFVARFGQGRGEGWAAQFNAMIAASARYGFVDEQTGSVRAHIENVNPN
jgi:hypothetical protein